MKGLGHQGKDCQSYGNMDPSETNRKERKGSKYHNIYSIASLQFSVNSSHWMNLPGNQKTREAVKQSLARERARNIFEGKQKTHSSNFKGAYKSCLSLRSQSL